MIWKGKNLDTVGTVLDVVIDIALRDDRIEAAEFLRICDEEGPNARENIGYIAGYCKEDVAKKIWDVFGCEHPVFGTSYPGPDAAFKMGLELGKKEKVN